MNYTLRMEICSRCGHERGHHREGVCHVEGCDCLQYVQSGVLREGGIPGVQKSTESKETPAESGERRFGWKDTE